MTLDENRPSVDLGSGLSCLYVAPCKSPPSLKSVDWFMSESWFLPREIAHYVLKATVLSVIWRNETTLAFQICQRHLLIKRGN